MELKTTALFNVRDKVCIVTGGSTGIGLMIVKGLVANGARVYITSRNAKRVEAVASQVNQEAAKVLNAGVAVALPSDVSSEKGCVRVAEELGKLESHVDVLINNAGTNWGGSLEDYPEAAFDKVMALNVKGAFLLTRALLPLMIKAAQRGQDQASVINVGSIDGIRVPAMETYAYSASKAAIHQLTRVLAFQLVKHRIRVNAIAPGPFESKMMKVTLDRFRNRVVNSVPMKRIGADEDMAAAAIFLASRASDYITGVVIPVDGGILVNAKL